MNSFLDQVGTPVIRTAVQWILGFAGTFALAHQMSLPTHALVYVGGALTLLFTGAWNWAEKKGWLNWLPTVLSKNKSFVDKENIPVD